MIKRPYTYTVLRYVHDPLAGEFANIGIVMFCPAGPGLKPLLKARTRKPIKQQLEARKIPLLLEEKTIVGKDDKIEFSHAWKNGAWHAYEPVSLDLADAAGIYNKAHRWLGQLTSVVPGAQEKFRAYLV